MLGGKSSSSNHMGGISESCVRHSLSMLRPAPRLAGLLLMLLLLATAVPPSTSSSSSASHSFPHLFPPRALPALPLIPRPPVCDMAHVSIVHASDNPSSLDDQPSTSQRSALVLHLPPFDLSAVATVQIIIDGAPISAPLPPFNDGGPIIMKASGFRAGERNTTPHFYIKISAVFLLIFRAQEPSISWLSVGRSRTARRVGRASQSREESLCPGLQRKCWYEAQRAYSFRCRSHALPSIEKEPLQGDVCRISLPPNEDRVVGNVFLS
jgi:hypothetical protein